MVDLEFQGWNLEFIGCPPVHRDFAPNGADEQAAPPMARTYYQGYSNTHPKRSIPWAQSFFHLFLPIYFSIAHGMLLWGCVLEDP